MAYDPEAVTRYFDALGFGEFERHDASPVQQIKHELHLRCLRAFVRPGSRVLDVGAGPGRFTEVLAEMGCQISVVDLSSEQLRLNEERARERGYADSIETWLKADVCDLSELATSAFDSVVAFGGLFSYVLDCRDRAMEQCMGLLAPAGNLLLSVMSKWGTTHCYLKGVADLPRAEIEAVMRTGDITAETSPSSASVGHYCHMFTADELRSFLESHALSVEFMSASNAISTNWNDLLEDDDHYAWVTELEVVAAESSGAVDMGTHIIAVAGRAGV